jgi:hypothetical protein
MTTLTDSGSQGWGAYGSVLAAMAVALALPLLLHAAGRILGLWTKSEPSGDQAPPRPRQIAPTDSLNTRYFSAMMMAGLMTMPLFMLLPLISTPGASPDGLLREFSALATISVSVCVGAALIYANRKLDLKWNGEIHPERREPGEAE